MINHFKFLVTSWVFLFLAFSGMEAEEYRDNFYFVGKNSKSPILFQFEFDRHHKRNDSSGIESFFKGRLFWKSKWFLLGPQKYPTDQFEKRFFPKHPAFDFSWPIKGGTGKFSYHYDKFFLEITFNPLLPLHHLIDQKAEQSELFIANAALKGRENILTGILIYHRTRLKNGKPLVTDSLVGPYLQKFCFLNGKKGYNVLFLEKKGTDSISQKRFLQIKQDGDVVLDTSSFWIPKKEKGKWKFRSPMDKSIFTLSRKNKMKMKDESTYYLIRGNSKKKGSKGKKLFGFFWTQPFKPAADKKSLKKSKKGKSSDPKVNSSSDSSVASGDSTKIPQSDKPKVKKKKKKFGKRSFRKKQ